MAQIIQFRRDYSSNWTLANPVLAEGELGVEFDNYNVKIGNGISSWNQLPYGLGTVSAVGGNWNTSTITGTNILISTGATNTLYYPGYITTAALSNHTHDYASSDHSHTQYLTTAAQSDHMHSQYVNTSLTSQWLTTAMVSQNTSVFIYVSNSSLFDLTANASLSIGTSYTTHTHNYQSTGNYLTTAALSNHTHGSISIASTVGSDFAYSSASNGMSFSIPKWITTYAAGGREIDISAGGSSASLGSLVFSNGSGVSFGLNGSTITGSVKTDYQSQGAYLTTAAASDHTHSQYLTTAMASNAGSLYQLTSDNSLSLGTGYTTHTHLYQSTGNYLTTAIQSNMTSAFQYTSNTSNITSNAFPTASTTQLAVSSVASRIIQINGSSGSLSLAIGSSLSSSSNASTITFGLASNITTALQSAGAYLTTAMASGNTSLYMSTSERGNYFYTSNNTFANNTHIHGGLTINATNISTSITSASNGLTINLSAAAPSASGGIVPNRSICEIIPGEYLTRVINISATQVSNKILFNPFWLDGQGLVASTVRFMMSWVTNTTPPVFTYGAALYKMANSTQATLYDSTTATVNYATSQSASYSGIRVWDVTGMTKSLDEGRYILGLYFSYGATSNANASLYGASNWPAIAGYISGGSETATTNNTLHLFPFQGRYSTTTNGFPNTVNIGDIYGGRSQDAFDYYAILKQV